MARSRGSRSSHFIPVIALVLPVLASLSGCRMELHSWVADWLSAGRAPAMASAGLRSPSPSPSKAAQVSSDRLLRQDAQLLREMFHVVLLRDPSSVEEFGYFMGPITQGGSIEGTYNGIVNSDMYHRLEEREGPASPEALRVFSRELIRLEEDLPRPTDFDIAPPLDVAKVSERFRKYSVFYLKRVLANEALKVIEAKETLDKTGSSGHASDSGKRAGSGKSLDAWYGRWAAALAREHVDFGIPLRNVTDPEFHRQWAAHATEDRLSWEVLNRVHRLLDAAEAGGMSAQEKTFESRSKSG